jgi:hypothetical protein
MLVLPFVLGIFVGDFSENDGPFEITRFTKPALLTDHVTLTRF